MLYQILVYIIRVKIIEKSYINNEFKYQLKQGMRIWVTWRIALSEIQSYFKYIIEKHETVTDNLTIRIYANQIENTITYKIKARYI